MRRAVKGGGIDDLEAPPQERALDLGARLVVLVVLEHKRDLGFGGAGARRALL